VLTPTKTAQKELGLIILGGALIANDAYLPLANEIMQNSDYSYFVGIPKFLIDAPNPI